MKTRLTPLILFLATVISVCGDLDAWNNGTNATVNLGTVQVRGTNAAAEIIVTNGITLGGVRNTSWPSLSGAATLTSLTLTNTGTGTNAVLVPDAANTLALRNGANAQQFNFYKTYTDASNYERIKWYWSGDYATLEADKAGTGSQAHIVVRADSFWADADTVNFRTLAGVPTWSINSSGHILAGNDNSYDIGAAGASRPRNIYVATSILMGTNILSFSGTNLTWNGTAITVP